MLLLKWNNGNRRLMYWLQDKNADKDADNVTKFNDFVKNPNHAASPAPGSAAGGFVRFSHCHDYYHLYHFYLMYPRFYLHIYLYCRCVYCFIQALLEASNGCKCLDLALKEQLQQEARHQGLLLLQVSQLLHYLVHPLQPHHHVHLQVPHLLIFLHFWRTLV